MGITNAPPTLTRSAKPRSNKGGKRKSPVPFKTWLISGLRKLTQKWPPYYETLNRVASYQEIVSVVKNKQGSYNVTCDDGTVFTAFHVPKLGRRKLLTCELCHTTWLVKDLFPLKKGGTKMMKTVVVDHINPIVDMYGFEDWNSFIDRAFPQDKEGPVFQAICRICHDKKIAEERGERNERKRDRREAAKASSKASP